MLMLASQTVVLAIAKLMEGVSVTVSVTPTKTAVKILRNPVNVQVGRISLLLARIIISYRPQEGEQEQTNCTSGTPMHAPIRQGNKPMSSNSALFL